MTGRKNITSIQDIVLVGFLFSIRIVTITPMYINTTGMIYHFLTKAKIRSTVSIYANKTVD